MKYDRNITFRLSQVDVDNIDELARRLYRNKSDAIRLLVAAALEVIPRNGVSILPADVMKKVVEKITRTP